MLDAGLVGRKVMHHLHREAAASILKGQVTASENARCEFVGWMLGLAGRLEVLREQLEAGRGGSDAAPLLDRATRLPPAGGWQAHRGRW